MTNHEPLFTELKHERLTHAEKRAMRAALVRHMREHATPSPYAVWGMMRRNRVLFAGTAIGAILFGGTITYAAERALPGDVLYEVKISINERAKVALAKTEEAQALVQVELAERRLKEAEKLALLGKLSDEKKVMIEEKLATHLDRVQIVLAQVELNDEELAHDLESDLKSSIDAHRSVIAAIREGDVLEDSAHELEGVDQTLAARFNEVPEVTITASTAPAAEEPETGATLMMAKMADDAPDTTGAAPAATVLVAPVLDDSEISKALAKAEEKRAKAVRKVEVARATIGDNAAGLERLADAEALLAEGDMLFAADDYGGARERFEQAARRAQEGKRVSELERELNVKVKIKIERSDDDNRDEGDTVSGQGAHMISIIENTHSQDDRTAKDPSDNRKTENEIDESRGDDR